MQYLIAYPYSVLQFVPDRAIITMSGTLRVSDLFVQILILKLSHRLWAAATTYDDGNVEHQGNAKKQREREKYLENAL